MSNHADARVRCAAANPSGVADIAAPAASTKPTVWMRVAKLALALAVLFVMLNGERWVLEHSPAGADELIVATCAANVAFGTGDPTETCASAGTSIGKESSSK